jgi:hypothetical protein
VSLNSLLQSDMWAANDAVTAHLYDHRVESPEVQQAYSALARPYIEAFGSGVHEHDPTRSRDHGPGPDEWRTGIVKGPPMSVVVPRVRPHRFEGTRATLALAEAPIARSVGGKGGAQAKRTVKTNTARES